ncbi:Tol-Pal system beta propeller repeat protein TolB [Chitinibacteraceae bacterium HSL-7]
MLRRFMALLATLLLLPAAHADISFEVVGTGANQYPIAISSFRGELGQAQALTPVIGDDLERSGLFRRVAVADIVPAPSSDTEVNAALMVNRGAQTALVGRVDPQADGSLAIKFWLVDVTTRQTLIAYEKQAKPNQLRRVAHQIADMVFEKIVGEPGAFSSRIAYVTKVGKRYSLQVADADGYGAQTIVSSATEPVMSPKWSPDGSRLAYVSFEQKKPVVYVQELSTGKRWVAANFKGSNSAPAWSPDGRSLAVVLTRDGGSQIFIVPATGGEPRRVSRDGDINTEPWFSPDGRTLYFTSDRGGSPQIYRQGVNGGAVERVTYQGGYNASPKVSPDGKWLTFITRDGGFRVAIMDLITRQVQVLTDTRHDDSPSFAPNSRMILFETDQGGRGVLSAVSRDGRVKQRLKAQAGDVRQPAWGPMLK